MAGGGFGDVMSGVGGVTKATQRWPQWARSRATFNAIIFICYLWSALVILTQFCTCILHLGDLEGVLGIWRSFAPFEELTPREGCMCVDETKQMFNRCCMTDRIALDDKTEEVSSNCLYL